MKRLLFFLALLPLGLFAQEEGNDNIDFTYKGFVDTYYAAKPKDDFDLMSSRTRLRFEAGLDKGNASAFVSFNAIYNSLLDKQTGFFLREAYLQYQQNGWELKAGKQIVTWGVADGLRVTDLISPMDYTEFLAQDYDDIRVPVGAFKIGYGNTNFHIEGIFVPRPEFFVLPADTLNPWSVRIGDKGLNMNTLLPYHSIKNSEFGARMSFYFSGIDFSLCALRTWNKMPVISMRALDENGLINANANFHRMTMLGGDVSIPIGKCVVRGEFAQNIGELQSIGDNGEAITKDVSNGLVGLDWYAGDDWTVMLQYNHLYINKYESTLPSYRNSSMATVNIQKQMLHNTLKLSAFGRIDCTNEGAFFIRFNGDYNLTDQITLTAGYDWFRAKKGSFAMYDDNSEVFVKAKYSF